jgi:hypothetical protein
MGIRFLAGGIQRSEKLGKRKKTGFIIASLEPEKEVLSEEVGLKSEVADHFYVRIFI